MNVKKYLMIVCCVVGVCLAGLSGVIVATRYISEDFSKTNDDVPEEISKPNKERANILVMGTDKSGMHTDTIMLISLDNVNKKINILSIPRDTRVVHNGQYDKLNVLYAYNGKEENTIRAVKQITGLPIHYYAIVDFTGFRNIIDILGGVDFEVPNINKGGMYYDDPAQNLHISLKAGMQHLNGAQAEGLVRYRSGYPEADLGRIKMQQQFVKELIKQKLQLKYIGKALEIYREITKYTETNFTLMDAKSYLGTLKAIQGDNIQTFSLPGHGSEAYTRYGYASCFIYNASEIDTLVKENFTSSASGQSK